MDSEHLQDLARVRASGDLKNLKRVMKDFYRLVTPALLGEELEAAHESFLLGLDQLSLQLSKTDRLKRVTEMEVVGYEAEARSIEEVHASTRGKISSLNAKLEIAQRDRARAIEYDVIAKSVEKLPNRNEAQEAIKKLSDDIVLLKEEQKTYKETWKTRQDAFDEIVQSLTSMGEAIAEEKNEQERRRALEDDEENSSTEEPPLPPPITPVVIPDANAEPFEPKLPEEGEEMEGVELEEGQEPEDHVEIGRRKEKDEEEMEEKEEGEMDLGT